jgi:transcriptional regulator NrdR family protein
MNCPTCGGDTKVTNTQNNQANPVPHHFQGMNLVRRRRVCLRNLSHTFFSLELTEEQWERIVEVVESSQ